MDPLVLIRTVNNCDPFYRIEREDRQCNFTTSHRPMLFISSNRANSCGRRIGGRHFPGCRAKAERELMSHQSPQQLWKEYELGNNVPT